MFIVQSGMNHHQTSVSHSNHINSSPGGQYSDSNQSSSGRNILFKPIDFVSNHRRSASLSGLVKRSSIRKNKSKFVPTSISLNPTQEHPITTDTSCPSSQHGHISRPINSLIAPRLIIDSDVTRPQTSLSLPQSSNPATVHLNTLAIIQPRSTWSPAYDIDRRCFRVNLHHPRQQVTSLLALSSIPRPVTPPFDDERENTAGAILLATRTAMEEEAFRSAIAASIETENNRLISHWADHQKSQE